MNKGHGQNNNKFVSPYKKIQLDDEKNFNKSHAFNRSPEIIQLKRLKFITKQNSN